MNFWRKILLDKDLLLIFSDRKHLSMLGPYPMNYAALKSRLWVVGGHRGDLWSVKPKLDSSGALSPCHLFLTPFPDHRARNPLLCPA
jgi:hypothetical protein